MDGKGKRQRKVKESEITEPCTAADLDSNLIKKFTLFGQSPYFSDFH